MNQGLRNLFPPELLSGSEDEQIGILQLLAKVTRIANPPEALTSIASYYERLEGRQDLWNLLADVIRSKKTTTRTHKLLAEAAKHHLAQKGATDYLIITTNYDCLMETALDDLKVPYIVLTTRKTDPKVLLRCSENVENREVLRNRYWNREYPGNFVLSKAQSVVIIYKIHGCLHPDITFENEGLVVSDNDYVDYVTQMSKIGIIPATVSELMREKRFWFLGYSLRDWNLRVILRRIWGAQKLKWSSWAIQLEPEDLDQIFWLRRDIQILEAGLRDYVTELIDRLDAKSYVEELVERLDAMESRQPTPSRILGGQI